jgi:hypothetical protein
VPGVSGKRVIVYGLIALCGDAATDIVFSSKGTGPSTAISCVFQLGANGGIPLWPVAGLAGWCATKVGEALTVTTGPGSITGIQLLYDLSARERESGYG